MDSTNDLIAQLLAMVEQGGRLTTNRILTIVSAAERLAELDERIAIMSEDNNLPPSALNFPAGGNAG